MNYLRLYADKLVKKIRKQKLIFARRALLRAVKTIIDVSAKAGNGSFMTRSFILHEIDTFLEYRAYKKQGYKVRFK